MGEGLKRMGQMRSAEIMMDLAVKANNRIGFAAGAENYASAAWDYIGRIHYGAVTDLMEAYRTDKNRFWTTFSEAVFTGDTGLTKTISEMS